MKTEGIEEVTAWKTDDSKIFVNMERALDHKNVLTERKLLNELVKNVKLLFKQKLDSYDKAVNGCGIHLETEYWEAQNDTISQVAKNDIFINGFEEYVQIIRLLLKDYHLEKVIKIIKKTEKGVLK